MSASANDKSVVDRILDASVFAPLGLVLTRRETLNTLAKAGRKQIAFSRSLGRAALRSFARGATSAQSPSRPPADTTAPAPADTAPVESEPAGSAPVEASMVEGYDELTAKAIVALLGDASDEQARWIGERERAGKNRVTVLRAVDKVLGK